jgi:hypothetical protein
LAVLTLAALALWNEVCQVWQFKTATGPAAIVVVVVVFRDQVCHERFEAVAVAVGG